MTGRGLNQLLFIAVQTPLAVFFPLYGNELFQITLRGNSLAHEKRVISSLERRP